MRIALGGGAALAQGHHVEHLLLVDRVGQRTAEFAVIQRGLQEVDLDFRKAQRLGDDAVQRGGGAELGHQFRGQLACGGVDLAGLQGGEGGRLVGDDRHGDGIHRGLAGEIVLIRGEGVALGGAVGGQLVRSGADRQVLDGLGLGRIDVLPNVFGDDRQVGQGYPGQRRTGVAAFEAHGVIVDLGDLFHIRGVVHVVGVAPGRGIMHVLEGEHDIFGGEGLAVLPRDVGAQVGFPDAGLQLADFGGQPRLRLIDIGGGGEQLVVDHFDQLVAGAAGEQVQRAEVLVVGDADRSGGGWAGQLGVPAAGAVGAGGAAGQGHGGNKRCGEQRQCAGRSWAHGSSGGCEGERLRK